MLTAPEVAPSRFRWDRLTYASAVGYAVLVCALSIGVVLGELREQFHLSGVVAALHGSTFGIGLLVSGAFGVRAIDRVGRRTAMIIAVSLVGVGVTVFVLGPAWPVTLAGTVMSGLGGALLVMLMPGIISDHHGEHRAAAFAAVNAVPGAVGVAFALLIGAAIATGWSWRIPYLGLTVVCLVALVAVGRRAVLPAGERHGRFRIAGFLDREVLRPWLHLINAALVDFTPGVWAVVYLHEVGGASDGAAPALSCVFGVMMFVSRLAVPAFLRRSERWTLPLGYVVTALGAVLMVTGPGLAVRVAGLALIGFGAAPLYPLTVDRFYSAVGHRQDSVSMGAFCALASGVAVTAGPLALGVLADIVGLQYGMLVVPALCVVAVVTQRRPA